MPDQPVGQIVDNLGTEVPLSDGDLPTDALVLLKVVKADGSVSLAKGKSETLDWITALGMLTAALEIENNGYEQTEDDDG